MYQLQYRIRWGPGKNNGTIFPNMETARNDWYITSIMQSFHQVLGSIQDTDHHIESPLWPCSFIPVGPPLLYGPS